MAINFKKLFLIVGSDPREPIAFYAYFSNDFKSMPKGSTFVFDVVETNLGNGYNKATGILSIHRPLFRSVCIHMDSASSGKTRSTTY